MVGSKLNTAFAKLNFRKACAHCGTRTRKGKFSLESEPSKTHDRQTRLFDPRDFHDSVPYRPLNLWQPCMPPWCVRT